MNIKEFNKLYNILLEQIQKEEQEKVNKDKYLIEFEIQDTKFSFFKNQEEKYICKFNFDFLNEPQQVTVLYKNNNQLQFKVDDSEDVEQTYDRQKFKEYFYPQFQLFKEATRKFKEYLISTKKIKEQKNSLTIIPLEVLMKRQENIQQTINIDGIIFNIAEIKNTYKDMYRADFEISQAENLDSEKYITAIFKTISVQNYYILEVYLSKENNDIENANELSKDQFAEKYPTYFSSLNQAIKTFLKMNH